MPTRRAGWRGVSLITCVAIAAAVLTAPDPNTNLRSALALHDFGHVVAFGVVAALFAFALSARSRSGLQGRGGVICLAACAALALGVAVELAQAASGATGDPWDVMRDAGGAFSMALLLAAFEPALAVRIRAGLAGVAIFAVGALAYPTLVALDDEARAVAQFPVLASFERTIELSRFRFDEGMEPRVARMFDDDGRHFSAISLHLRPGAYPGFVFRHFPRDWRDMRALQLLIVNPESVPMDMTLRIDDADYDYELDIHDRYNRSFSFLPGTNRIEIPLSDIAAAPRDRRFDLGRVQRLLVYAVDLEQPHEIIIGPIVLLP